MHLLFGHFSLFSRSIILDTFHPLDDLNGNVYLLTRKSNYKNTYSSMGVGLITVQKMSIDINDTKSEQKKLTYIQIQHSLR